MREKIARFMAGRNGNDQLNRFLLLVDIVLLLIVAIFKDGIGRYVYPFVFVLLAYAYFRMLSRNVYKRRARYKVSAALRVRHERWVQRKDYKFFTCPNCKTALRVPRGHGKVNIVCRKCGTSFTGKT